MELLKLAADFALVLTFGALIWYSIETRKMRKAMDRQNEQNLRPIVFASFEGEVGGRRLFFRNEGLGPAIDIKLQDFPKEETNRLFIFESQKKGILFPREHSEIIFTDENNRKIEEYFLPSSTNTYDVEISYSNIHEVSYRTIQKISGFDIELLRTERIK